MPAGRRMKLDQNLSPRTKTSFKWTKTVSVRPETARRRLRQLLQNMGVGKDFLGGDFITKLELD